MRKITLLSAIAAIACVSAFAEADVDARFKAMEDRLNKIEKENSDLKSAVKSIQSDELGARMNDVEKLAFSNKVIWGLGMKNMDNYLSGKMGDESKYYNPNLMSTKFMLNMESEITKSMKFTGRLSMYKNWANNNGLSVNDSTDGRKATGSQLFVERAYVDWTAIDGVVPVIFTIGRQPSSDGPSYQFRDNTVRKSTYSALAFDGAADGLVTTIDLEKATGVENAAIRLAYGKGYQNDASANSLSNMSFPTVDRNGNKLPMNLNAMNGLPYVGGDASGVADTTFYGIFLDGSIPGLKGTLLQIGAVKANNLNAMGYDIGDALIFGAMAEFTNVADSGLDAFAHYGVSKVKSNGTLLGLNAMLGNPYPNMGLLSTTTANADDQTGSAYWLGFRYDLSKIGAYGKFGYEYNHGTKNWFSFTSGSNDITNKLATRGTAHEVYYIAPINKFAYARIGAQSIKYDYTGSGSPLGAPMKISDLTPAMGSGNYLKELQNLYLNFNLQY